jgi:hypothetical protein
LNIALNPYDKYSELKSGSALCHTARNFYFTPDQPALWTARRVDFLSECEPVFETVLDSESQVCVPLMCRHFKRYMEGFQSKLANF